MILHKIILHLASWEKEELMKIGIFLAVFRHLTFDKAIENVKKLGINTVEISTTNHPDNSHCDAEVLLKSKNKLK